MAALEAVTAAAWATAETQYADHSIRVSDIAKLLGLSAIELSNAAKARGWPLRTATGTMDKSKAPSSGRRPPSAKGEKDTNPSLATGTTKESRKASTKRSPSPLGETGLRNGPGERPPPSCRLRPSSPQGKKDGGAHAANTDAPRLTVGSTKESRKAQTKKTGSAKESRKAKANPVLLVQRVYATIDGELSKLEDQQGTTSQDRERASRALSQITNSLEKAVEMQRDIKKAMTKASGRHDKEALAHAEDLRRAIAERLERLQRQRSLGKRSGGAE